MTYRAARGTAKLPLTRGATIRMTAYLRLLRPHQWIKNGFVFLGLLFGHAWDDPHKVATALYAFAAFCLVSSAVYVLNDLVDREQDRLHPRKRHRPLASGSVTTNGAVLLMVALLLAGMALALAKVAAAWVFVLYVALNVGYSFRWKHVVILDVFIIASGFMLRILAGTLGLGLMPSHWLLLCGLMLTLFLGFAKRRAELVALSEESTNHRRVLHQYSEAFLDQMISVAGTGTVVSYSLYTVSPDTVALHGTAGLIYTVPFVLYGMFRYLFRLHLRGGGADPALELLRDPHLALAAAGWLITTVVLLS